MYKILVVDDNHLNRLVAVATLTRLGYGVEEVDDGLAAVKACASERFDAVIMDLQMPGMDGYETTARIRHNDLATGYRHPIIALSARSMPGDREAAIIAGLDDYLTKPLRQDQLREMLDRWIGAASARSPSQ